jgi:hypothetical protein
MLSPIIQFVGNDITELNTIMNTLEPDNNSISNKVTLDDTPSTMNTNNYSLSRAGDYSNNRNSKNGFDPNTQYLIITPSEFLDALEPLITWKHQKGIYSSVATLDGPDGINSTYSGPDLPARIHAFLREYYNHSTNLKWLLLVGDSEIIPPRLILTTNLTNSSIEYISNHSYSDYYYSALDTTWDNNSNQVYGEPGEEDWVPELYVGRLPVNNVPEVKNVVNKILIYEKTPPPGNWFNNTIQCGALMDRPNVIDDPYTVEDEGYNNYKDNARKAILKVREFIPNGTTNSTFLDYNKKDGGDYTKENDKLNESLVVPAFNKGASTVNFVAKGDDDGVKQYSGSGLGRIEDASTHFFSHSTLDKLDNGYQLPLIYTSSCTSVNFTETDDSNLECLITSPTNGAIGLIGATIDTYRLEFFINNTSFGNWWLDKEFWRRFYTGEGNYRPGEILYNLKADYYLHYYTNTSNPHQEIEYQPLYRTNFFSYNLLGDPEVPIYTDVPKKLRIQHPEKILPISRDHQLTIKVFENGNNGPVPEANVCIIGKNSYFVQKTDNMGVAKFDLEITDGEILGITVTAHNYYYYESTIEIEARQDVSISQEDIMFNRNPIPPGATVDIMMRVWNNGESDLSNVKVNCYADQISTKNLIINPIIIDLLVKGTSKNISFNWTPEDGSHNVSIVLDYNDEIFEFNESNNIVSILLVENKPPIWLSLPQKLILEDTTAINAIDLESYAWDEDTLELQFYISNVTPLGFNMSIYNSKLSLVPPPNWYGIAGATVIVTDGTSIDQEDLTIIVDPVNDNPILNDTIDWILLSDNITLSSGRVTVFEDTSVQIKVVASDFADNNTNIDFACETNLFIINSTTGIFSFTPTNSMVGVYTLNFSVDDGELENNIAWRLITMEILNVNDPPEIKTIEKHFVRVGENFILNIKATDIDENDSLTFGTDSELFDINPTSGEINFTPYNKHIGTHRISITVTDGNASVSKEFILEIGPKSDDPVDPNYVILCPIIIVITIILLFIQEFIRNKRNKEKRANLDKEQMMSEDQDRDKQSEIGNENNNDIDEPQKKEVRLDKDYKNKNDKPKFKGTKRKK